MATPTDSKWTPLGPGSMKITVQGAGGTAKDFSCEVLSAKVLHAYEENDTRRMLCGTVRGGGGSRTDGFGAEVENDLTAEGLYKFLFDNDLKQATVEFVPNTDQAASWSIAGVVLQLPEEIGADEFGNPLASEVEWTGGIATFTPAKAATAPAAS